MADQGTNRLIMRLLEVLVNQQKVLEFNRNSRLPGKQREFLDKMDFDMDEGFYIDDKRYDNPDILQRGNYVAIKLLQAIQNNNQGMMNAMCAYLVNRLPGLNQIAIEESGEEVTIKLHFEDR